MKKRVLYIYTYIFVLLCLCLFSCRQGPVEDRFCLPTVNHETVFEVDAVVRQGGFCGDSFVYLDNNTGDVFILNLSSGDVHFLTGEAALLSVDASGICIYQSSTNTLRLMNFDGEETKAFSLEEINTNKGFTALDSHDGIIVLTDGTGLWIVNPSNGKSSAIALSGGLYREIERPQIVDKNHILFVGSQGSSSQNNTLYECSSSGKITGSWSGSAYTSYCKTGDNIYYLQSQKLYRMNQQGSLQIAELDPHSPSGKGLASIVAISGDTAAICWYSLPSVVTLVPLKQPEGLRVLTAASGMSWIKNMNAVMGDVAVPLENPDTAFRDKLTTKLLAEDDDFDLVYITDQMDEVGSLFRTLAENGRFVDLKQNAELKANLDEMLPGVQDLVSTDGKVVCLPLNFNYTLYGFNSDGKYPCPDFHWTVDDLWDLCGYLETESDGRSVFSDQYAKRVSRILLDMINSMLLERIAEGNELTAAVTDDITDFLRSAEPWLTNGILFGKEPILSSTVFGDYPFGSISALTEPNDNLLAPPTIRTEDSYCIGMTGFIFVNPASPHIDEALAFLAEITDETHRYNLDVISAPLFPGLDKYYYDTSLSERTRTAIPEDRKEWFAALDGIMDRYYVDARIGVLNITERAWNAVEDFCAGQSSPEETAKVLYEEIVYSVKG